MTRHWRPSIEPLPAMARSAPMNGSKKAGCSTASVSMMRRSPPLPRASANAAKWAGSSTRPNKREQLADPPQGIFQRRPHAHIAARGYSAKSGAADFHPRLSALGDDAGRADIVGPSPDRRRRRAALCQRDHGDDAAHPEQPARLPRGVGRVVDGRPPRRARRVARLLSRTGAPARPRANRVRRGSPTRCRSTKPISG